MMNCGIYQITNTATGDFYIGSSANLKRRLYVHRWMLVNNTHDNIHLQRAFNKYGDQAFEFTAILLCDVENQLYYEQILLDGLKPSYNIAICAMASQQGLHPSEATRVKLSLAHTGKHHTEETRALMSAARKGELHPMFGKHPSEATIALLSESHTGKPNGMLGKHHTLEARAINSAAHIGKHHTDETRRQMSESQRLRRQAEAQMQPVLETA